MRRAVGTDRNAGMRTGNLDVRVIETDIAADLLPSAPRTVHRIRRDERNLTGHRETRAHRGQQLLLYADFDEALRKGIAESLHPRRFDQIRTDRDHVRVAASRLDQTGSEAVARRRALERRAVEIVYQWNH